MASHESHGVEKVRDECNAANRRGERGREPERSARGSAVRSDGGAGTASRYDGQRHPEPFPEHSAESGPSSFAAEERKCPDCGAALTMRAFTEATVYTCAAKCGYSEGWHRFACEDNPQIKHGADRG